MFKGFLEFFVMSFDEETLDEALKSSSWLSTILNYELFCMAYSNEEGAWLIDVLSDSVIKCPVSLSSQHFRQVLHELPIKKQ